MFEWDWSNRSAWQAEQVVRPSRVSSLDPADVEKTALLHWREHCLECAVPSCYESCPLHIKRADQKCARFAYGIVPNKEFSGIFSYGADIRFRRWGKLESQLAEAAVTPTAHRRLDVANRGVARTTTSITNVLFRADPKRRLNGGVKIAEETVLAMSSQRRPGSYDAFVIECFSTEAEEFRMIFEVAGPFEVFFRTSFPIVPGHNYHEIPWMKLEGRSTVPTRPWNPATSGGERIRVYPEGDEERRLIFTWLDLVTFGGHRASGTTAANGSSATATNGAKPADLPSVPAKKVKCVALDLDNTLWSGILIEDGAEQCQLRDEAKALVSALDDRGILLTIASKNDHDAAWELVTSHGLDEYFLYPAIGWGPKSESLLEIAKRLNIGIDTFAFIDDSSFERGEVGESLPMVRVYPETDLLALLDLPEFTVPITETSRTRRKSYLNEMARERAVSETDGNYSDFLRSCNITMRVFSPATDAERERCFELIGRSNQLNLSGRKYTREELAEALASPTLRTFGLSANDRFGDYGIIGFCSVDMSGEVPRIRDLFLSCRIARRGLEPALVDWLAQQLRAEGFHTLHAEYITAPKNLRLRMVLEESLPITVVESNDSRVLYALDLDTAATAQDIVTIDASDFGATP